MSRFVEFERAPIWDVLYSDAGRKEIWRGGGRKVLINLKSVTSISELEDGPNGMKRCRIFLGADGHNRVVVGTIEEILEKMGNI